jgi:hypothetical protein
MNYVSELSSGDVLQRTSKRIPNDKRVRWNDYVRKICHSREPGLPDLEAWLKDCVDSDFNPYAIEARPSKQYQQSSPFKNSHGYTAQQATLHNTSSQAPQMDLKKCPLCSEAHHISKCCKYTEKSAEDRYALVKANRLCFNCLYPSHQIAACTSNVVCKVPGCKSKHHTSLHRQRPASARGATHDAQVNVLQGKRSTIYFQVLAVIAQGHNGRCISTYALLDSASDITLINSDLAHDLGLRGQTKTLTVNTMTSSSTVNSSCVSVSVRESNNPNACPIWIQEAWTKKGCFNCSPVRTSDIQHLEYVSDLHLIDIDPSDIKILIGANVPKAHLQLNVREGSVNEPVAIQTHLGWCLMGPSSLEVRDSRQAHVNNLISFEEQLNTQVEKFWKTESFGVTASICKPISVQDRKALVTLESETRFVNGHYQVPMLWKKVEKLPDDRGMAERRFQSLQKRLSSNIELKGKYSDVLNGYIAKGHARKLTNAEIKNVTDKTWYLPHHCVLNPKKPEKVRVVFDAAATFQDVSLNSRLITGPDLLNSIFGVLQRFRLKPVAVVADISDMFHQVRVPEHDSDALRFLWKADLDDNGACDVYKMLVHIFGATDSPCCTNFALQHVAHSMTDKDASDVILRNFYVDDMLMSADSVAGAIHVASSVSQALAAKGFELRKWMSTSDEVLRYFSNDSVMQTNLNLDFSAVKLERALGVGWNVQDDAFFFSPVLKDVAPTKRGIVSAVSSIFDPCGFLAPFVFTAKTLIQDIWAQKLQWDENIPTDLQKRWESWQADLAHLQHLLIPRHFGFPINQSNIQLHLFSDASEAGFASVAYLRSNFSQIHCSFVAAKTHVAPIKQVLTIPKLELQGAVMSVRLACSIRDELDVQIIQVVFWTDSLTVLKYITNETRRWKIFVANRISEIRENSDPAQWKYVPSKLNPADQASRGVSSQELSIDSMWFRGPSFLWQSGDRWPEQPDIGSPVDDDENLRKVHTMVTSDQQCITTYLQIGAVLDVQHFSSWHKLKIRTAWILRAVQSFLSILPRHQYQVNKSPHLTSIELQQAEMCLVRHCQREVFCKEVTKLKHGEEIEQHSSLHPLDPYFDTSMEVIRVGGRLRNSPDMGYDKHQIILPYDHHITHLIARDVHQRQAHCGPEHMIAILRQTYWPIKCRQMTKRIIHNCFDCRRRTVKPTNPIMADLPLQRTAGFTRAFQYTGVDYFGPMCEESTI